MLLKKVQQIFSRDFWKHLLLSALRVAIVDPASYAYERTVKRLYLATARTVERVHQKNISPCVQSLKDFLNYWVLLCQVVCLRIQVFASDLSRYLGVVFIIRCCCHLPEEYQIALAMFAIFRLFLGTLYPAYASYKAVRTKNVREYVSYTLIQQTP